MKTRRKGKATTALACGGFLFFDCPIPPPPETQLNHLRMARNGKRRISTITVKLIKISVGSQSPGAPKPQPAPKTDKPRPHVCGTCQRSFARLEHLKRHERSHTKEKPFECPECTRCFARRDLLLRHQQKLHMTATPSSRPRAGSRRESTSSATPTVSGRVRKNSMSNNSATPVSNGDGGAATMRARPRANTIAHIDSSTLGMIANSGSMSLNQAGRGSGPSRGPGIANMGIGGFGSAGHHGDSK